MSYSKPFIMLVHPDATWCENLKIYFERHDITLQSEQRGDLAVRRILEERPDAVVMNYSLPHKDGKTLCKELRASYPRPLLVMHDNADEIDEIIMLELGVDAFLASPITPRRLLSYVTNRLQRYQNIVETTLETQQAAQNQDSLQLDLQKQAAIIDGQIIPLTSQDFDLLRFLYANQGIVLTREEIFYQMRNQLWDGTDRSIDLRISRLRNKLNDTGKSPRFIKSIHGLGYMMIC